MKTKIQYFCSNCGVRFEETGLPNINRHHHCGTLAKILDITEEEEGEEKAE